MSHPNEAVAHPGKTAPRAPSLMARARPERVTVRDPRLRKTCRPARRRLGRLDPEAAISSGTPIARIGLVEEDHMREVVLYVEDHPVNVLLMQTVFELRPE